MNKQRLDLVSTCNFIDENKVFYPNIHTILLVLLSLPVGSCSCEQSLSALRRLKTWCCNSMMDERQHLDTSTKSGYLLQRASYKPGIALDTAA